MMKVSGITGGPAKDLDFQLLTSWQNPEIIINVLERIQYANLCCYRDN